MSHIIFVNGTLKTFESDLLTTWRWECLRLTGNVATLHISLNVTGEIFFSIIEKNVKVNVATREVFLMNGTTMGTTFLWVPTDFMIGEQLVLWNASTEKFMPTVQSVVISSTPQGSQQVFIIQGSGTILERVVFLVGFYDLDTGVLIDGEIDSEVTLFILGIKHLGINGRVYFVDTNINLGPKEQKPENVQPFDGIFITTIILITFAVFILLFYKIQRIKHKNKKQINIGKQCLFIFKKIKLMLGVKVRLKYFVNTNCYN
ncbi:MAG: hypothetical protein IAX21_06615 [Candidatus Bathyarchaeota archaeon]|nr:MAG: hypothetical protein IAX21_06615 [Candidatus Bathyarchaeota archaeon]